MALLLRAVTPKLRHLLDSQSDFRHAEALLLNRKHKTETLCPLKQEIIVSSRTESTVGHHVMNIHLDLERNGPIVGTVVHEFRSNASESYCVQILDQISSEIMISSTTNGSTTLILIDRERHEWIDDVRRVQQLCTRILMSVQISRRASREGLVERRRFEYNG